jgi:anti-sigma regulatory factor (Ser/Thr protein kinase)
MPKRRPSRKPSRAEDAPTVATRLLRIITGRKVVVPVPKYFTRGTMYGFIGRALDEQGDAKCSSVTFDFAKLEQIDPVGVVVLSNLIEHFKNMGVRVVFRAFPGKPTEAIDLLSNVGFFRRYGGNPVVTHQHMRDGVIDLELVESQRTVDFLFNRLMPWMGLNVGLSADSLDTVRACLEEIFHNITDHSGVTVGCVFAQHEPNLNRIHIAISDFGVGIPRRVREHVAGLSDQAAIAKACEEGFTTKSNVRNRGAGLPNLMRYVTTRNQGTVLIASGRGELSAVYESQRMKTTARTSPSFYPGTLVTTILRTDTIEAVASDVAPEEFAW